MKTQNHNAQVASKNRPFAQTYHSPDTFFAPQADANADSADNAVNSLLDQAQATITCLMADGDDGSFSLNHKLVLNLLWAVDTQISMAKAALQHMNTANKADANDTQGGV